MSAFRIDGYAPIRDYAAIGDGRAVALVAVDGRIDWLALPSLDAPATFAAVLDDRRGGFFMVEPEVPYEVERRYLPDTNVLETTFRTARGVVRVVDAVSLDNGALLPWTELTRRIEAVDGAVPMRWSVEPRFDFGRHAAQFTVRRDIVQAIDANGELVVAILHFDAGEAAITRSSVGGTFVAADGRRSLLALVAVTSGPLPCPGRDEIEARIDATVEGWRSWTRRVAYRGPWREAVVRSALALRLLLFTPSGALAAAPTTSLPERLGGDKNYDYRFSWLRDTSFALDALMSLGMHEEANRMMTWLTRAVLDSYPDFAVFLELDGERTTDEPEAELDLDGYRGSRPARVGNHARGQLQIGNYGDVFETLWLYYRRGNELPPAIYDALAATADHVCEIWQKRDSGIWELDEIAHYTISKIGAWVALDRVLRFVDAGEISSSGRRRWETVRADIRRYVEHQCWNEDLGSYSMCAGGDALDAACLLSSRAGFDGPDSPRMLATIRAVRAHLSAGPLVYRYSAARHEENAFVACSFWLVAALASAGARDDAAAMMDDMVALANDVGLYSEEIDPATGDMFGNFPQGLSHLALVTAACAFIDADSSAS